MPRTPLLALALILTSLAVHAQVPDSLAFPVTPPPAPEREIRAQVTARVSTLLSSEMSGRVLQVSVRDGDRFEKNQVLVRFDCAAREAQLARARAGVQKARAILDVNRRLQHIGSVSAKEVAVGEADAAAADAEVALAKVMVEHCVVHAPFSGRVAGGQVKEQQSIGEGQPLLDILDDRELEVETIVPSRWLTWLKPGFRFAVRIDETGASAKVEVTHLSGRVDPVSQSIKLYATFVERSDDLLPGMSGRAVIEPPVEGHGL